MMMSAGVLDSLDVARAVEIDEPVRAGLGGDLHQQFQSARAARIRDVVDVDEGVRNIGGVDLQRFGRGLQSGGGGRDVEGGQVGQVVGVGLGSTGGISPSTAIEVD